MANQYRRNMQAVVDRVSVLNFLSYREYLNLLFKSLKKDVPGVTHKDFSELLGFSKTNNTIRLVITGHRILTKVAASTICKAIGIKGLERRYLLLLVDFNNERVPKKREETFNHLIKLKKESDPQALNEKQIQYFGEWYHPIIREMMDLEDLDTSPEGIQQALRFPLRLDEIKKSLQLLEDLGVIKFDAELERYIRAGDVIETGDVVDSLAITQYHQKMIEMGKDSITRIHESVRTINAVTVSIPVEAVPLINQKMSQFLDEVLNIESEMNEHTDVFQINVQVFPFTKAEKD
ncbi:TIGR02147 family protein [Pseudobacteriovorax antillogorgiicola]|uniref:TIGR02147 family protein n=1 Tax=Pseudobacteriovorax antillogorgiicola TaxID=1513793 RepID=A0A1Y6BKV5_9BACT|nr:TIGR02147 family protein [Pseudobacteriovorax antillogorgiicola]TCS54650.1 uncharacterized protein (TIGR02147 family) [Pseudobacteriovorax antillogorgiicola]SMF16909.1 TIGR02147 family protein [Pseudobacteriovorax antillogorgiicola]